jgi:hypothetical protein
MIFTIKLILAFGLALIVLCLLIILPIGALYGILFVLKFYEMEYEWKDIDWNNDGRVTVSEMLDAIDTGKRDVFLDQKKCVEYFFYKDARSARIKCPPNDAL